MLFRVTEVRARPEKVGEAEELGRLMATRGSASGERRELAWSLYEVSSGAFGSYRIVSEAETWEEVGAVSSLDGFARALFGERADAIVPRMLDCFDSITQSVSRSRADLSWAPGNPERGPTIELTRIRARPDGQAAMEQYFKSLVEAVRKLGDARRFYVLETLVGELGSYTLETPVRHLGELDTIRRPDELLTEAFGERRGTEILETTRTAMLDAERHILARRDDLSSAPSEPDP